MDVNSVSEKHICNENFTNSQRADQWVQIKKKKVNELEDWWTEIIQSEGQREKRLKKNKHTLSCLWDNIKWYNICVSGVPERKKREKRTEKKYLKKNIWKFQFVVKQQIAEDKISLVNPRKNKMDRKQHLGRSWSSSWKSEIKNYLNSKRKEITYWGTKTKLGRCFIRNNGNHKTMERYL